MGAVAALDGFQQRHRWAGFPLGLVYKFVDDQGSYLAALLTYYAFLSLFPLLLLLATVLAVLLRGHPDLQQRLLDSALGQFPLLQGQLSEPQRVQSSGTGLVLTSLTALYGSLGVGQAAQNLMNTAWGVPRNSRGNPFVARGRSVLLLLTAGLVVLGTTVLTSIGSTGSAFGADLGPSRQALTLLLSVGLNLGVFLLAMRIATAVHVPRRHLLPGALAAAVLWQLLQLFGTAYVMRVVAGSDATSGAFALVLGLIAWLFLGANMLVLCVEANVVLARRLYPRALLTPFTDSVDLTGADQRAYAQYARAQRAKGFETVDVRFAHDGQYATALRDGVADPDAPDAPDEDRPAASG